MDQLEACFRHNHYKSMLTILFQIQSDPYIFGIYTKSIYSFSDALFYLMSSTKAVCKSPLFWTLSLKQKRILVMYTMVRKMFMVQTFDKLMVYSTLTNVDCCVYVYRVIWSEGVSSIRSAIMGHNTSDAIHCPQI